MTSNSTASSVKRIWLRPNEQPGSITINNNNNTTTQSNNNSNTILSYSVRKEINVTWIIPYQYFIQRYDKFCKEQIEKQMIQLQQQSKSDDDNNSTIDVVEIKQLPEFQLEFAVRGLKIGLFRRGCADNTSTSSIISKSILDFNYYTRTSTSTSTNNTSSTNNTNTSTEIITGIVPFFTPRTPGTVLFRLYYDYPSSDTIYTLGISPIIRIRIYSNDFDSTIRFLLSNFNKNRTTNTNNSSNSNSNSNTHNNSSSAVSASAVSTSLAPLHSLAIVLETPVPESLSISNQYQQQQQLQQHNNRNNNNNNNHHHHRGNNNNNSNSNNNNDTNAVITRSIWGCLQESRKVILANFNEYCKTTKKLNDLEEQIDLLKNELLVVQVQQQLEEGKSANEDDNNNNNNNNKLPVVTDETNSITTTMTTASSNNDNANISLQISNLIKQSRTISINDDNKNINNVYVDNNSESNNNNINNTISTTTIPTTPGTNTGSNTNTSIINEKIKSFIIGRSLCERKWHDAQISFALILKSIVKINTISLRHVIRKELLYDLSLEYELYCPICEQFATLLLVSDVQVLPPVVITSTSTTTTTPNRNQNPSTTGSIPPSGRINSSTTASTIKPIPNRVWYESIYGMNNKNNNNNNNNNTNTPGRQQQQQQQHQNSSSIVSFHSCSVAKRQMQLSILGFEVNTIQLDTVLYPPTASYEDDNNHNNNNRVMDRNAVNCFNSLSNAMGYYYQQLHSNEHSIIRQRECIRQMTQQCVTECGAFPPGTEVLIFGSSANGFGSPQSDIDMCLQIPPPSQSQAQQQQQSNTNDPLTILNKLLHHNDDNNNNNTNSSSTTTDDGTKKGSVAMGKFAEYLSQTTNMKDIDTNRLTARIPVVRFLCPKNIDKLFKKQNNNETHDNNNNSDIIKDANVTDNVDDDTNGDTDYVECDLSMHNPLAVMNTSYLLSYAQITPLTRVFMAAIKRWAKARDINSPSRHTLSSYGYTIMLLHFLTYHKRTGTGLVEPIAPPEGLGNGSNNTNNSIDRNKNKQNNHRQQQQQQQQQVQPPRQLATPLLPNLHWMDPKYLLRRIDENGTPVSPAYIEFQSIPRQIINHPFNDKSTVNTYYYSPRSIEEMKHLQSLFANQDLSLAILLASFFRYYAYEFDFKKYVVSTHSTATYGLVERETKAEFDGWRNYSTTLAIEDPFELEYDVAHVLRGAGLQRIRREFALAYTKIVDAATAHQCAWHSTLDIPINNDVGTSTDTNDNKIESPDVLTMTGRDLFDWICLPVSNKVSTTTGNHDQIPIIPPFSP